MKFGRKKFCCPVCKYKQEAMVWDNKEVTGVACVNLPCTNILNLSNELKNKKSPKAPGIRTPTKNRV